MAPDEFETIQSACIRIDDAIFNDVGLLTQDLIDQLVSLGYHAYDVWAGPWTGARKAVVRPLSKRHSSDLADDVAWVRRSFMVRYPLQFADKIGRGVPYAEQLAEDLATVQDERLRTCFETWVRGDSPVLARLGARGLRRLDGDS